MKAFVKVLLIVGSLFVIAGGVLLGVGIARGIKQPNDPLITNPYSFEDGFKSFDFDLSIADLEFKASEDGTYKVECVEKEKLCHEVKVEGETLTVVSKDTYKWYEKMFGYNGNLKVTVYMPSGAYGDLNIKASTGDIIIPEVFTFDNITAALSTGDTNIRAKVNESLVYESSTGDVLLEGISPKNATIKVGTGKMKLSKLNVAGDLKVESSTGRVELTEIRCKTLKKENGSTGDIYLKDVIAETKLSLHNSTGDIVIEDSDSSDIYLHTSTGDITGTFLTGKIFTIKAKNAEVPPNDPSGGTCTIETSTGKVRIQIKG